MAVSPNVGSGNGGLKIRPTTRNCLFVPYRVDGTQSRRAPGRIRPEREPDDDCGDGGDGDSAP